MIQTSTKWQKQIHQIEWLFDLFYFDWFKWLITALSSSRWSNNWSRLCSDAFSENEPVFFFRMRTHHLCYFVDEWLSVDIDWHLIVVHRWRFERCNTVWDFLHELVGIHVLWSINKHKFIRSRNVLFKLWRDNLH